jgi:hypothetical protein
VNKTFRNRGELPLDGGAELGQLDAAKAQTAGHRSVRLLEEVDLDQAGPRRLPSQPKL